MRNVQGRHSLVLEDFKLDLLRESLVRFYHKFSLLEAAFKNHLIENPLDLARDFELKEIASQHHDVTMSF